MVRLRCSCGHQGEINLPFPQKLECSSCGSPLLDDDWSDGTLPEPKEYIATALVLETVYGEKIMGDPLLNEIFQKWAERGRDLFERAWGVAELERIIHSLPINVDQVLNLDPLRTTKDKNLNILSEERFFCAYLDLYKIERENHASGFVKMQIGTAVHNDIVENLIRAYGGNSEVLGEGDFAGHNTFHHIDWTNKERLVEIKTTRWIGEWKRRIARVTKEGRPYVATLPNPPNQWIFNEQNVRRESSWYFTQADLYGFFYRVNPVNVIVVDLISGQMLNIVENIQESAVSSWLLHIAPYLPPLPLGGTPLERHPAVKRRSPKLWNFAHAGFWCGSCPKRIKGEYDVKGNPMFSDSELVTQYCPRFRLDLKKNQRAKWR